MWLGIFISCLMIAYVGNIAIDQPDFMAGNVEVKTLAVMMAFLTLSLIYYTLLDYKLKKRKSWPHAIGRIEDAKLVKKWHGVNEIRLVYSYVVQDREYTNDCFDFAQEHATVPQVKLHPELRGYLKTEELEGKMIKVYFDREAPWKSAISRRLEQSPFITIIPAALMIIFCLYSLSKVVMKIL